MEWSFEEDYIVCKFYLAHVDSTSRHINNLMEELSLKGFGCRREASVKMRIQNYKFLHTGQGLSNATQQSRSIYASMVKDS